MVPSEHADEEGLTLVEMLVAIVVIGFVLMAMASVALASLRSVQTTERVTNATQLGNELLESYVALPYDDLGLYTTDATTTFSGTTYDGATLVLFPDPLTPDPSIPPATQTLTRSGVTYEVTTAVVWIDDTGTPTAQDYKRVIVESRWQGPGGEQTARVEALRAPGPADQPLSVTITPDIVDLDDAGGQLAPVTITVEAKETQTTVTLQWLERDGSQAGPTTMADQGGGRLWTTTVDGRDFANGATLFTVTGTLAGTTEKEVTTLGRGLFLQPLEFASGGTTITPSVVTYQPADETNPGEFCTDAVHISSQVDGALLSDPVTVTVRPDAAVPLVLPLTGDEVPTVSGTRFWIDVPVGDLDITGPGDVPVRLTATRPLGDPAPTVTADLLIPVQTTEPQYDSGDPPVLIGYAPCP